MNPQEAFTVYNFHPPITWKGTLNNEPVLFKQLSRSSNSIEDFEFEQLPDKFAELKGDIVTSIDNFLKKELN